MELAVAALRQLAAAIREAPLCAAEAACGPSVAAEETARGNGREGSAAAGIGEGCEGGESAGPAAPTMMVISFYQAQAGSSLCPPATPTSLQSLVNLKKG